MLLREELRRRLLEERGIYAKECCDKCGQVLGPVRYTRKDEEGVWCSGECRGDAKQTIRRGGRPRKYRTPEQQRAAKTRQQRVYRFCPSVEKTPLRDTGNKGLAGTKSASLVVDPYPPSNDGLALSGERPQ